MERDFLGLDPDIISYAAASSTAETPLFSELREETASHPLSIMQISPVQGQLLQLLVRATGARRIVEVGVFTGYSSLSMALALPDDGELIALDIDESTTAIARRYWEKAGIAHKVELRLGPAEDSLRELLEKERESFDLIFIDADKRGYPTYWELGLALLRPGGVVLVDNALFAGAVLHATDETTSREHFSALPEEARDSLAGDALAMRRFNELVAADERTSAVLLPLFDGLTIAVKKISPPGPPRDTSTACDR